MNIKQLKEAIKDLPDDLVITIPPIEEGIAYEVNLIERFNNCICLHAIKPLYYGNNGQDIWAHNFEYSKPVKVDFME